MLIGNGYIEQYELWMGALIANLQSLECILRFFLYKKEIGSGNSDFAKKIYYFKEGDFVEENAFTNFDTLGQLIDKYNGIVGARDNTLCVDRDIVDIRDALAHGRIASESPSLSAPQKLVKYTKPKKGHVRVTHCVTLTKEWLDKQINLVGKNILRVQEANR